jgi:hypothetical protein
MSFAQNKAPQLLTLEDGFSPTLNRLALLSSQVQQIKL